MMVALVHVGIIMGMIYILYMYIYSKLSSNSQANSLLIIKTAHVNFNRSGSIYHMT